jgi:malonyl CoA-acyl carrier protein transacylase
MQKAVPVGRGAMVAVVGDNLDHAAVAAAVASGPVSIANDNSDGQIVLSGPAGDVRGAAARLVADVRCGAERSVELDVSAPFHSWMMRPVEASFAHVLAAAGDVWDASRATAVTSNVTGRFHDGDSHQLRCNLVAQLSATVRWRDNMTALAARPSVIFEIGPSRPLRGFLRSAGLDVVSIVDLRSAERALAAAVAA